MFHQGKRVRQSRDQAPETHDRRKLGLGLDRQPGSPLAKALDQVVAQYLAGVPDGSGHEGALRPFDPDRDLLVITTNPSAPASVRAGLATLISNLVDHPGHLALSAAAHNESEEKALPILLGHLRRSPHWVAHRGAPPTDGDLRALFRVMRLEVLGLERGQEQRGAAEVCLTEVLADRDRRSEAFDALAGLGGSLSAGRWWMSRQRVFTWLRDNGFPPVRDPRVYADVRELRARSDRDLDADLALAVIDAEGGPVPIDRDIEPLLAGSAGTIVVVGPPGAGKTSIAARVAKAERDAGRDVAYLRAGDLAGTDGDIRKALSIAHNLSGVLAGWIGPGQATLVIDGLDATRMSAPSLSLLATLASLPPRWRLVATARAFDLKHSPAWKKLFRGAPVDEARSDPHLQSVRHLMVDRLTDLEIMQVSAARPELAPLFDPARPRLAELVRNPFNLNLAAGLLSGDPARVFTVRSQLDLLMLYWDQRVATGPAMYGRLAVLEKLAREMIRRRRDRLHRPHDILITSELAAMQGLLSDGVLREAQAPGYASTAAPVAFAHALLFDFTVANQVLARLEDPMHLAGALAAEPDWALLLRSSLELHLAALWHGDPTRKSYFALAARLTTQSPLAANAAAEIPLRERLGLPELEPLISYCLAPGATAERLAARRFTSQLLAGALHLRHLPAGQKATAVPTLAAAARRLAEAAERDLDIELASTATVIVNRIRALPGWQPDWPGADDCGMAAAAITRTALADPEKPGHEHLGHRAADLLTDAVRIDPELHGPLVARFADPAVMTAWGVSAASVLARAFDGNAAHAPGPATALAVAVWAFTEERDETTYPSPSQLAEFTGNRQADLEGARYDIGTAFPAVLARNPPAAVEMYLRIIEAAVPPPADGLESALFSAGGGTLAGQGHGALLMMTGTIADYLDDLARQAEAAGPPAADALSDVLGQLTGRLRNLDAWSALLSAGTQRPATLGIRLMPVLCSGQLLRADPASRAAAGLIQAVAPDLDDDEHGRLEAAIVSIPAAGYAGHLRDRLLGALDRARISDPRAKQRLTALDAEGGPPRIEGPVIGSFRDISLAPPGPHAPSGLSRAAQSVREDLSALADATGQDQAEAAARLRDSFLALISRIEQHDESTPAPGSRSDYHDAAGQAVAAAARLAEDPGTGPGSAAGTAVLNTLLGTVAVAAGLNPADTEAGPVPEAPTARAAEGVLALLCRNDWAASPSGARIGAAARGLLEHDQAAVRAVGVSGLHFIVPLPAARYARITELIQDEAADFVRARLLVQLASLLPDMPAEVDRSLADLGSMGTWPVLAAAPQAFDAPSAEPGERPREIDFVVQILIRVALLSGHGSCQRLLATWLDDPAAFCYRAQRACLHLRDWLTAGNADSSRTREDAFAFLTRPVAAIRLRPAAGTTAEGHEAFGGAARVAAMVSRNLKITADAPGDIPAEFAALAFPLLEQLAEVGRPAIVHDIVRVLKRIAASDPKRTILTVATAVAAAPGYAWEPDGAQAALDLVDTTVAEHRDRILADPQWTSALRQVLEGFVAQGINAVIAKVHDLDVMFG